ncbi:MAG: RHS repeat-associated core domain-containing protein, partial [Chloroflexota bacterium]
STMTRGAATNYSYDRADRITAAGAVSYTVNANGNLVAKGTDSFAYDQANRMKSATVGGATSTYAYNGDGVRHSKTVAAVTTTLVNDVNRGLPVVLDDGTRKYVYGLGLAYAAEGSAVLVYHTDGLGSVRATTDATGAVTNTYKTDEFGVPVDTQGTSSQAYRYTGEPRDAESGLVYLRARMYDPSIGRFMGRDRVAGSVSRPSSLNRYSYVENDPIGRVDPSGLKSMALSAQGPELENEDEDDAGSPTDKVCGIDGCGNRIGFGGGGGRGGGRGGLGPVMKGRAGEQTVATATGQAVNTAKVKTPSGNRRIPDFYDPNKTLWEVKNAQRVSYTPQIADMIA